MALDYERLVDELDLSATKVTDQGLEHLARASSLRQLRLQRTADSAAGIEKFRAALPQCNVEP